MSTERNLTLAYASCVEAGLFKHKGRSGFKDDVPDDIKTGKRVLSNPQKDLITGQLQKIVTYVTSQTEESELLRIPDYNGPKDAKGFLQELLEVAKEQQVEGADAAIERIGSLGHGETSMESGEGTEENNKEAVGSTDGAPKATEVATDDPDNKTVGSTDGAPKETEVATDDSDNKTVGSTDRVPKETASTQNGDDSSKQNPCMPRGRRKGGTEHEDYEKENYGWTEGEEDHRWPWDTFPKYGDVRVMAEKQTNIRSGNGTISYYLVEIKREDEGGKTFYTRELARAGDYPREVAEWVSGSGKKCIFQASKRNEEFEGRRKRGDKETFRRLEFIAPLTPQNEKVYKGRSVTPAECIVSNEESIYPVFRTIGQLKVKAGKERAWDLIMKVCERDGQQLPQQLEPRELTFLNPRCEKNETQKSWLRNSAKVRPSLSYEQPQQSSQQSSQQPSQQPSQSNGENSLEARLRQYIDQQMEQFGKDVSQQILELTTPLLQVMREEFSKMQQQFRNDVDEAKRGLRGTSYDSAVAM